MVHSRAALLRCLRHSLDGHLLDGSDRLTTITTDIDTDTSILFPTPSLSPDSTLAAVALADLVAALDATLARFERLRHLRPTRVRL